MSYVQENLLPKEEMVYMARISLWALLVPIIIGVLLLPVFGFGLLFLIAVAIEYLTTELAITNKRVIAKFGFIRRSTVEISLPKIETIQVQQGFVGRIFNFGDIIVTGAGNPRAVIRGIQKPLSFRRQFLEWQEAMQTSF